MPVVSPKHDDQLAWVLRDPTVASTLIGASSVDQYASDSVVDLWRESSDN